jgi:hypothetical protein
VGRAFQPAAWLLPGSCLRGNFVHKSLQRLYADEGVKGVPSDTVDKLRKMFAYLDDLGDAEELRSLTA